MFVCFLGVQNTEYVNMWTLYVLLVSLDVSLITAKM